MDSEVITLEIDRGGPVRLLLFKQFSTQTLTYHTILHAKEEADTQKNQLHSRSKVQTSLKKLDVTLKIDHAQKVDPCRVGNS